MDEDKKEKSPAVLFYTSDFLASTILWSYEDIGKYIRLLCLQHQQGGLSESDLIAVAEGSEKVMSKFKRDENGLYFNARMRKESEKREKYLTTQAEKGAKGANARWHSHSTAIAQPYHSQCPSNGIYGNGNENENINDNVIVTDISNKEIREMQEREEEKRKIVEIITYLNSKLKSRYTFTADYINKHIRARLSEGFTVEDFKTVIDKKHREWSNTDMAKFLRPETLFGTKFQQYLNQPDVPYVPKTAIGRCGVEYYVGDDATTDLDGIIGD